MGRVVALISLVFAATLLGGCGGGGASVLPIATWSLVGAAGENGVTLPAKIATRLPPGTTSYALTAHVELPPELRDRPLTFAFTYLPALATLHAGGREGVPLETSALDRYRSQGPQAWRVEAEETRGGALDLRLDVAHTWVESASINTVPKLSATRTGDPWFVFESHWDQITAEVGLAATLLMSFTYGVLFLLDRRRTAHAWLAVQGLLGGAYPAVTLGLTQPLLGGSDVALTSIAICAAAVCALHFVKGISGQPPPSRAWWLLVAATVVAAIVAGGPYRAESFCAPFVAIAILATGAGAMTTPRSERLHSIDRIAAFGFPIVAILGVPDTAAFLGFGELFDGLRGGSLAFCSIPILQAIALSRSHIESLQRADQLNVELASRVILLEQNNDEIRVLNDELRRQVSVRSEHLAEALARLGPMRTPPRAFAPGDVVDARYRIVRRIGEGGMGAVYEIERVADGKHFALKVLQAPRNGAELARLAREAEIASRIDHPNVVGIRDVDVANSGTLFVVMDLVDGPSLDAATSQFGDVPWALRILAQIAAGLAALHELGIVHRDMKPGNVLVTRGSSGEVAKIADFGIATRLRQGATTAPQDEAPVESFDERATQPADRALTRTGQILGTPVYMAPELVRGAKLATPASDVYSFGVIAWELLTGDLPHGFEALMHLRSSVDVASIASVHPTLPPRIVKLLDACLAPDAAQRPTAKALAAALSHANEAPHALPRGIAS